MTDNLYRVTNQEGAEVTAGYEIRMPQGLAVFVRVTRGTEYNGTAKVLVKYVEDAWEHDYYAHALGLTVETIHDQG